MGGVEDRRREVTLGAGSANSFAAGREIPLEASHKSQVTGRKPQVTRHKARRSYVVSTFPGVSGVEGSRTCMDGPPTLCDQRVTRREGATGRHGSAVPPDVRQLVLVREPVPDVAVVRLLDRPAEALYEVLGRRGD